MRNLNLLLPAVLLVFLLPLGCTDEGSAPQSIEVAGSEVAETIGGALADSTGGITSQIADLAGIVGGGSLEAPGTATLHPSVPADTVRFDITRQRSGLYSYNYVIHFWYAFQITWIDFGYEMRGTYDTPRRASNDTAHAEWHATDLLASEITVSGNYERSGTEEWKARGTSWHTELVMELLNVTVSRTTGLITGGSGTVSLRIEDESGSSATYVATITFLGNRRASLLIGAVQYLIDLSSGAVITS